MKWWKRTAMPLPKATNYPDTNGIGNHGVWRLDRSLSPENAKAVETQHPDLDFLGNGNYGVAYSTQDPNTVIKLTFDESEAEAAAHLMKAPCPCVVSVLGVEKTQQDEQKGKPGVWKITVEKLKPLDEKSKEWVHWLFPYAYNGEFPEPQDVFKQLTEEGYYDSHLKPGISVYKLPAAITHAFLPYYRKYEALLDCLHAHGLSAVDAHEDNIGLRADGSYVILDLGGLV